MKKKAKEELEEAVATAYENAEAATQAVFKQREDEMRKAFEPPINRTCTNYSTMPTMQSYFNMPATNYGYTNGAAPAVSLYSKNLSGANNTGDTTSAYSAYGDYMCQANIQHIFAEIIKTVKDAQHVRSVKDFLEVFYSANYVHLSPVEVANNIFNIIIDQDAHYDCFCDSDTSIMLIRIDVDSAQSMYRNLVIEIPPIPVDMDRLMVRASAYFIPDESNHADGLENGLKEEYAFRIVNKLTEMNRDMIKRSNKMTL